MKITRIEKENISQIRSLWEELNKHHGQYSTYSKDRFKSFTFQKRLEMFEHKESFAVFAAKDKSNIVGYCIASVEGNDGEIDSLYVNPQFRNKSIGDALLEEAEKWLNTKPIKTVYISVAEGNESVFNFYVKQGYHKSYTTFEKKA